MSGRIFAHITYLWYLLPRPLRRRVRDPVIARLPSRLYMQTHIVPALADAGCTRMLFVGAQAYNLAVWRACDEAGIAVWSIDLDPASARYGAPNAHFVGDIRAVDRLVGDLRFDAVIFNGVLGYGVDTAQDALSALNAMRDVTTDEAVLVVGWGEGKTDDSEIAALRPRLFPCSLGRVPADIVFPAYGAAQRHPHRYEIFRFRGKETCSPA